MDNDWDKRPLDHRLAGAITVLLGFTTEANGLRRRKFLEKGSEAELDALRDLASIIRNRKLTPMIAETLANAILPEKVLTEDQRIDTPIGVQFIRRRGQRRDHIRDSHIESKVGHLIAEGMPTEDAIQSVADELGLSYENIVRIWRDFRAYHEYMEWLMKRRSNK